MKKMLLSSILLFFFTFGLNAQAKVDDNEKAKDFIQRAAKHASKKHFALAANFYQKAHNIDSTAFDGKTFYQMGLSYYKIKNYSLTIKYLEKALDFDADIEGLSLIYGTLSDSYKKVENYDKAILNAENVLYLAKGDSAVSKSCLKLAYIYYDQENYMRSIEACEKAIEYYLKHLSTTDEEVRQGKVKDDNLGEIYLKYSAVLYVVEREYESDLQLIKSALCGYKPAIEICEELGVKY